VPVLWALLWSQCAVPAKSAAVQVVIAIVDDGVDNAATQLRKHLATNPCEIPGNGIDDDRNGLVDDVGGYDFMDHDAVPRPANASGDPSHGTMMATVALRAACSTDSAADQRCGGRSIKILPLRVANERGVDPDAAAQAIQYAAGRSRRMVVNLSMGTIHQSLPEQVTSAITSQRDVLFVIAAGNQGKNITWTSASFCRIPAPNIVCVAAVGNDGRVAGFPKASNYGMLVSLAGLGVDVPMIGSDKRVHRETGTSLAAASVSGIAAGVWASVPELTASELAEALCAGARRSGTTDAVVRCGVADLAGAVRWARAVHGARKRSEASWR
jgi:subtilisin family serine protease